MGDVYLTWLADELRRVLGRCGSSGSVTAGSGGPVLVVVTSRAGRWCVMWHHTASSYGCSAGGDVGYMLTLNNPAYPTAEPVRVPGRGGVGDGRRGHQHQRERRRGTNHLPWVVPVDSMNTYAASAIEIGNNGVGEPYSRDCIDAAFTTSLNLSSPPNSAGSPPT